MILSSSAAAASSADTSTQAGKAQEKLEEDLNRFLNLLVTQLQNQDPLEPLDANEFTQQLVQFASVEQQIYQNANLEKMLALQQTSQVANMVDYLGTTAQAVGNRVPLENGMAEFTYALDQSAGTVNVAVQNDKGQTVFSAQGETTTGSHLISWDGKTNDGIQLPDGAYTVVVSAQNREGDQLDVAQTVFGRVTGTGVEDGAVSLFLGDIIVNQNDVLAVKETKAKVVN